MATKEQLEAALAALEASVAAEDSVDASAEALIVQLNGLYKEVLASGGTPQEIVDRLAALATRIDAGAASMATKVAENTPAAT